MKHVFLLVIILLSLITLPFAAVDSSAVSKPQSAVVPDTTKKNVPTQETIKKTSIAPAQDTAKKTSVAPAQDTAKKTSVAPAKDTIKKTSVAPAQDTVKKTSVAPAQDTTKKISVAPAPQKFDEEDILVDEADQKKMPAASVAGNKSPGSALNKDTLQKNIATPSASADSQKITSTQHAVTDSAIVSSTKDSALLSGVKHADSAVVAATIDPIRSINFAKNLKD
jgi:hypothetical protein